MIDINFRLPERKCQLEVFCLLVLQKLKINVFLSLHSLILIISHWKQKKSLQSS